MISLLIGLCLMNAVYGIVSAPYDQYCLPTSIEMKPEHYCGASAGCQPDPPGAASMAMSPVDAAYPVAALGWPASDIPWGFACTCFSLSGSRDGPWPAGRNLGTGPVYVQLYDWAPISTGLTPPTTMSIMYDPYWTVCNPVWNITASAWPTCYIYAQLVECPALTRLNSGNIILDFNMWNNAYTVLVNFRNSRLGIQSVSLTDSSNSTPTLATRSGGVAFIVGNKQVRLPFTLYITSINGETLTVPITAGYPNANAWGPSNFGVTYSVNSNVQFTTNYNCGTPPAPTSAPSSPPTLAPTTGAPTPPTPPSFAPTPAPTFAPTTAAPTPPTMPPTFAPTSAPTNATIGAPSNSISGGAIAGIVIGTLAGVALLGGIGFAVYKFVYLPKMMESA